MVIGGEPRTICTGTEYGECQAFCPIVRIGSPHPQASVATPHPLWVQGGRHTRWWGGGGELIRTTGQKLYCSVYYSIIPLGLLAFPNPHPIQLYSFKI
jgi:hypothetical protein